LKNFITFQPMEKLKLFMALVGCTLQGRHVEQHDIFFGIAFALFPQKN